MGFIFLHSCFMGFIFLWFLLWVHWIFVVLVLGSSDFHCSRSRLDLGSLEQLQEEGRWWFRENGARSRPPPGPLMIVKSLFLSLFWSTMVVVVGLVTLLAWVCWLIGGFGDEFGGFGDWLVGWIFGLVGGVVVVWLCWSVVVGSGFDFGFDCVFLGLLWLVSWSGFDLGWLVY